MPFTAPESDLAPQTPKPSGGFTAPESDIAPKVSKGFVSAWDEMAGSHIMGMLPSPRAALTGTRLALETLPVAAAQFVGGPAAGALTGGFTNLIGQGLENLLFDKQFDPAENAGAVAYGAIPIAGEMARAKTLLGAGGEALREGARLAGATTLIETPKVAYEKGRIPTVEEMATEVAPRSALAFAAGTAGGMVQQRGQEMAEQGRRAINFLRAYAGVRPTPGMVMPERFAAMERRMLETAPVSSPAAAMEEAVYRDVKQGLDDIVRAPQQKPEVYQAYANQIEKAREMASDSLEKNIGSILTDSKNAAIASATKSGTPLDDAAARDVMKTVADQTKQAYDQHWGKMFGMFDRESPIYDTSKIYKRIEAAFKDIGHDVPKELDALLGVDNNFMASRDNLTNVQRALAKRGKIGDVDIGLAEGRFRKVSGDVASDIESQADRIYPPEIAAQLKAVNRDYKDYLDIWEAPGVKAIFESNPDSDIVKKLVSDVIQNGVKSDDYSRIIRLIDNLRTPKAASNVVEVGGQQMIGGPIQSINANLADSLEQHVNSLVRSNIIHSVSEGGAVNPTALVSQLKRLSNDPQALQRFGFGSKATIDELETLIQQHPAASKLTNEQWGKLFSSPAFKDAIERGTGIASVIQPALAGTSAQNNMTRALFFRSAGDLENADKYLRMAKDDAAALGINFDATQKKYDQLAKLPDYAFFNKPGGLTPVDYNTLIKGVSDTSANKVTTDWVKQLKATLQSNGITGGNDLLRGLQRGYIQDHLVQLESAPRWSQSPTRMNIDNLAEFLAPNSKKGAEEMARAKALLDEDQIKALQESLKKASALRYYQRAQGEVKGPNGSVLPKRNLALRGWDAVGDMMLKGEWNRVAEAITNPKEFEKKLFFAGDEVKALGEVTERAAPLLQRFLPQQQQVPQNIQQFAQPQPTR